MSATCCGVKPMPAELGDDRGHQLAVLREVGELGEVEVVGGEEDREEGQQHRDAADHGVDEELGRGRWRCAGRPRA